MQTQEYPIEEKPLRGVSLKTIWAVITSTVIILGYMTNIKNGINDVAHSVDLMKQGADATQRVTDLKLDMQQKQIDGQQIQIKQLTDEIEKLKIGK